MRIVLISIYFFCLSGSTFSQDLRSYLLETSSHDTLNIRGMSVIEQTMNDTMVFSLQATGRSNVENRFKKFKHLKLHCEEGILAGWSVYIIDDIAYIESIRDSSIAKMSTDSLIRDFPLLRVFDLPFFNYEQLYLLERDLKSSVQSNTSNDFTKFIISSKDTVSNQGIELVLEYNRNSLKSYLNTIISTLGNQTHIIEITHLDTPVSFGIPKNVSKFKFHDLTEN